MKKQKKYTYIEWVVATAVMYATTFVVMECYLKIFYPSLSIVAGLFRNVILLLLLIYQIINYGIQIKNNVLFFFVLYSIYIFLYITVFPVYKLDDLINAPTSVINFFYRTGQVLVYILCAKTIIKHLKVNKLLTLSFICATIPAIAFIQFVGIDALQIFGLDDQNEDVVDTLSMGYCNGQLVTLGILFYSKLYNNKFVSCVFSTLFIVSAFYVIFAAGERGPILWTIVNVIICLSLITKNLIRYCIPVFLVVILLFLNIDTVIDGISVYAPRTAEKIEMTVKEGDTNGRFDLKDSKGSTYIIGINQFLSSPLYGSYFRLITNHHVFKGHYPHNVFIEVLMTMGLLGFIPFIYLLLVGWKKVRKTMKSKYTENQLACLALFLAAFLQLLTTTTIVFNAAFWCFFTIVCNFDMEEEQIKNKIARQIDTINI